jgi:UDP-N-acetylglucosamine--N-acetylmuramyl-(pentapeptide) pyrophosphoryl-undecaprenol N-acetylglucosamine transferase
VNARALAQAGAAQLLPQATLTPELLAEGIRALLSDVSSRERMAEASRRLGRPEAARAIVDELSALAQR